MSENTFGGFDRPRKNFFPMPNEWINICAEIDNLAELKVIQYVLRHTWGYQEYDGTLKHITIDEFMHGRKYKREDRKGQRMDKGTGMSNHSVIEGLRRAVEHKYLICEEDRSDKARIVKSYALNMKGSGVKDLHSGSEESAQQLPDMKDIHTGCETSSPQFDQSDVKDLHSGYEESAQHPMQDLHSDCEESTQRSKKDTKERHFKKNTKKERETPAPVQPSPTPPAPAPVSLSPSSSQNSLLEKLTDEQADFWQRWKGFIGCDDSALTEKLLPDVAWLAERITTIADLESLYQYTSDALLEYTKAAGSPYTPPHLKNLVRRYQPWKTAQDAKQKAKERDAEQASTKAVPGSGAVQNWTQARLSGKTDAPPIVYPTVERKGKPMNNMGIGGELMAFAERLKQRREQMKEGV